MTDLIVQFDYENDEQRQFCERKACEIQQAGRMGIASVISIGQDLVEVRSELPHGRWLPWLDAYFGWSDDTARRFMKVGAMAGQIPQIAEFNSVSMVLEFADLPICSQRAVLESGAYNRPDSFKRVAFKAAVEEHLVDGGISFERSRGDAYDAILDAMTDPVLEPTARELHERHREAFARLEGRPVAELDMEVRPYRDADTSRPVVTLDTNPQVTIYVVDANGEEKFYGRAEMAWRCNGDLLLIAPEVQNGPVSRALQLQAADVLNEKYKIMYREEETI